MINRIKWQLLLALFWFGSAYVAVAALGSWTWAWRCAWINLILGLLGLLLATRTDEGERLFYVGPKEDEEGSVLIAILWGIPLVVFLIASFWWMLRVLNVLSG
jgi:hypothetical protein